MSDDKTSGTFGGWSDRLTYIAAESQLIVLAVVFTLGAMFVVYRPTLPSVPPIVTGWLAITLLFGPLLTAFWITFVRRLRRRDMIEVHEVDAVGDTVEKYYIEPEVWKDKSVDGANPYPINGGSSWAVQDLEWMDDVDELVVKGVWLSECQDTKLLTKKSHMEAIYSKLTQSHITLSVMRDSVSELGADIQKRTINDAAEARERGTMMDETAVKDVFEDFEADIGGSDESDLPTLEMDEYVEQAAATDGGTDDGGETVE